MNTYIVSGANPRTSQVSRIPLAAIATARAAARGQPELRLIRTRSSPLRFIWSRTARVAPHSVPVGHAADALGRLRSKTGAAPADTTRSEALASVSGAPSKSDAFAFKALTSQYRGCTPQGPSRIHCELARSKPRAPGIRSRFTSASARAAMTWLWRDGTDQLLGRDH